MSGVAISSQRNAVEAHNRVEVALGLRANQIKMLMTLSIQLSRARLQVQEEFGSRWRRRPGDHLTEPFNIFAIPIRVVAVKLSFPL